MSRNRLLASSAVVGNENLLVIFALTNGGYSGNNLPQLQLIQDGGLSGSVQAHHQDAHLLFPNQALEKVSKDIAHDYSCFLRTVGPKRGSVDLVWAYFLV